ncbi:MAG: exo-alpha-sialidase [Verrucomicrobia bacterium]|nr:exo-alpha-sialidase [Verrucomicrobiota bacterium]
MNTRLIAALLSAVILAPAIAAAVQDEEQLRPIRPLSLEEIRARKTVVPETKQPRGCSIPTIDISHIKAFQIEVDRDPKQYLGHTTTAMLEDGKTIFLVYPTGHASGKIILKRSDDGGKTWSDRLPTPQSWNKIDNCPTLFRTVDKDGKRRLVLLAGMAVVKRAYSEDDGKTWSELEPISDWGGIVAMSSLVPLSGPGRYMALYHDYCGMEMGIMGPFMSALMKRRYRCGEDGGVNGFIQFKVYTNDGGLTWSAPEMISFSDTIHLCEPGAIKSPDGRQIAVLWRENSRRRNSFITFSDDEGRNWTAPRELPAALTGDRHTAKYLPDGRLFISFRDMASDSLTRGDWIAWVGQYNDLVNGTEGSLRIRLMDNAPGITGAVWSGCDCAYPGVEILPDGTIFSVTYGKWDSSAPNYIMAVRFKLNDLLKAFR